MSIIKLILIKKIFCANSALLGVILGQKMTFKEGNPPSVQSDVISTVQAEFADMCLEFSDWLGHLQLTIQAKFRPITELEPFHS